MPILIITALVELVFEQAATVPVSAWPIGTILLLIFSFASGVLNLVQLGLRNAARKWETAAKAAEAAATAHESNLTACRERAAELTRDNEVKARRIGELEAKTDLDVVKTQIAEIGQLIARESAESRLQVVQTIQSITKEMMAGFSKHAEEDRAHNERVANILNALEGRIREVLKK